MILIFGGTTEGRTAVEVCEQAGKQFYYSTKTDGQKIEMKYGTRLTGAMDGLCLNEFCKNNNIDCIIDAAHPFAENLHETICKTGIKTIRLQRDFGTKKDGIIYCKNYEDAVIKMKEAKVNKLLALTGTNTISKLKKFWTDTETYFRILNREDSIKTAQDCGFDNRHIIFYNDKTALPSKPEEKELMEKIGCDAIITKESGSSGGFEEKTDAALELGIKIFAMEHPKLPAEWVYVQGAIGLRRAIEKIIPDYFDLKTGLSTGTCATAAVKAAVISLVKNVMPTCVEIELPCGEKINVDVETDCCGMAHTFKDFSDDPDVTRGSKISAEIEITDNDEIEFIGGPGVGTVTLPGLGLKVGGPAINKTPRDMMGKAVREITDKGCRIKISVENGAEIAKRTFNNKVGVEGGISIIGTSGIVYPLSNEAFERSLKKEFEVAKAIGCKEIGLVSGKKGENALTKEHNIRCIHYGNKIGKTLEYAQNMGFERVVVGIMIGKAVKLAEGHMDTHSGKAQMNIDFLKEIADEEAYKLENITMARELWDIMSNHFFEKIENLCYFHCRKIYSKGELTIRLVCEEKV